MRRSHSSSSIPMSLQNRRDSRTRERAKSTLRVSREKSLDVHTPTFANQRVLAGGTDRKYSAQKNQLRTPTTPNTFTGLKRSSSLSSFGSRVSVTRNKSPGTKNTWQKLVNDKKWVAEKYSKVQNFIHTSGLFNPDLAGMIRPPTIAIFVEIITVLFRHIIKTVPITHHNYGDVVMQTLKLLRYPGQVTNSFFKTVNVMHAWPHFIAIVSWLIDRIDLGAIHDGFREQQDEEVKEAFNMYDAVFDFVTQQYNLISENASDLVQTRLEQSEDQLYEEMLKITGTDQDAALKLNERLESEGAELADINSRLQEIEEENLKIETQNTERQNIIDKYEESKGNREHEVKEELEQLKKLLNKHVQIKAALDLSNKKLEDSILKQSCKYKEKTEMINQIEDLKRAIERKERKLAEYRVVRDELDYELRTLVNKIESKVDSWNVSITKTFLPELKRLRLREKGFHTIGFLEEITEIRKETADLQEKLLKECKTSEAEIEKLQKQKASLVERSKVTDSDRQRLDTQRNTVQSIDEQNRKMFSEYEECKKNHELSTIRIKESEGGKVVKQEQIIAELNDSLQKITEKTEKTAQEGMAIIIEAHRMAVQNIQKLEEEVTEPILKKLTVYLAESKQNLENSFDHLVSVQETTAKLYQVFDEENKENLSK